MENSNVFVKSLHVQPHIHLYSTSFTIVVIQWGHTWRKLGRYTPYILLPRDILQLASAWHTNTLYVTQNLEKISCTSCIAKLLLVDVLNVHYSKVKHWCKLQNNNFMKLNKFDQEWSSLTFNNRDACLLHMGIGVSVSGGETSEF